MTAYTLLICIAAFLSATTTAETTPAVEISQLRVDEITRGNTSISFYVRDPNPLSNATQHCVGSWAANSTGYPQGRYSPCGNGTLAWNMISFTSIREFDIGIESLVIDPAVGQYPYDEVVNFAQGSVNETSCECATFGEFSACTQRFGNTILAPIYATMAKLK